jgi:hypothetical protein
MGREEEEEGKAQQIGLGERVEAIKHHHIVSFYDLIKKSLNLGE